MFKFRCLLFQQRIKFLSFLQYVSTRDKDVARHGKSSAAQAWNVFLPHISASSAMLDMNIIKNMATNNPGIQLPNPGMDRPPLLPNPGLDRPLQLPNPGMVRPPQLPNPGMDRLPLSPLSHGNLVSKCSKDLNIK